MSPTDAPAVHEHRSHADVHCLPVLPHARPIAQRRESSKPQRHLALARLALGMSCMMRQASLNISTQHTSESHFDKLVNVSPTGCRHPR